MKRRDYLCSVTFVLSGCAESNNSGSNTRGEFDSWFWLQMESVNAVDIVERLYPRIDREPIKRVISEGNATDTTTRSPLVEPGSTLRSRYNGTVYALQSERIRSSDGSYTTFTIEINPIDEQDESPNPIKYEGLPSVDRNKLASEGFEAVTSEADLGYGILLEYTPDQQNQSVLVPTLQKSVIEWESGIRGELTVVNSRELQETTYRYTAESLGELNEVGETMKNRYVFKLDDLTQRQQQIIQQAIESPNGFEIEKEQSEESYTSSKAVNRIYGRFASHTDKALEPEGNFQGYGEFLVEYQSQIYWATLRSDRTAFQTEE